jgi:hypothetical protein
VTNQIKIRRVHWRGDVLEREFIGEKGALERGFIREVIYWREGCIGEGLY